ncbi:92_t:CDS:1, partial [Gigaspora margarita]
IILLVKNAWDTISTETTKNCWHHTGILPSRHLDKIFLELEIIIDKDKTQNIQVFEVIVTQYEAQNIIDLTINTESDNLHKDISIIIILLQLKKLWMIIEL